MVDNKNQENQDNQYLRIFIKTFTVLFLTMGIVTLIINLYFSVHLMFDESLDWKFFLLYMFLFPLMPGFWHFIVKRGDGGSHLHDLRYPGDLFKLGWLKLKDS